MLRATGARRGGDLQYLDTRMGAGVDYGDNGGFVSLLFLPF